MIAVLAQVNVSQIPKDFSPPWWLMAATLIIGSVIVLAACSALYYCNWSFRQFINQMWSHIQSVEEQRNKQVADAHVQFTENLKTIADRHTVVADSVDKLADKINEQTHAIGEIHRAVVKPARS